MELMLEKTKDMACTDLTCDREMQAFYRQFGMTESYGMMIRRYENRK
jgi:hypothetical protein